MKKKQEPIKYVTPLQILGPKFGETVAVSVINELELYCRRHKEIVSGHKDGTYGCIIFDRPYGYIEAVGFTPVEEQIGKQKKPEKINDFKLKLANKILQDFFSLPNQPKPQILKEDVVRFSKILEKHLS